MKLNIPVMGALLAFSMVVCPILYLYVGPELNAEQSRVFRILWMIAACSAFYCFVVGEISRNNSQMDKIWSLLPIAYTWIIAVNGNLHPRLVAMACLATLWGARLTFNFARKGAYSIKFWAGVEDYRWKVVRSGRVFKKKWAWALFNLGFICIYHNVLVLMTTFPALVAMPSEKPFGWVDGVAAGLMLAFIIYEAVADEQQWRFQTKKWEMINSGMALADLPAPYNKGFNTTGLWSRSRHPNYFAEQGTWVSFYIFSIGAGMGVFNWSIIGSVLLMLLFQGSSTLSEQISGEKYSEYARYYTKVSRFFPGKKY